LKGFRVLGLKGRTLKRFRVLGPQGKKGSGFKVLGSGDEGFRGSSP